MCFYKTCCNIQLNCDLDCYNWVHVFLNYNLYKMNFGSKYVYNYSDSEEEFVSDDEFDEGMTRVHSDEEADGNTYSPDPTEREVLRSASVKLPDHAPQPSSATKERPKSGLFGRLFKSMTGGEAASRPKPETAQKKSKKRHHWLKGPTSTPSGRYTSAPSSGKKWRRADTNIISVNFETLKKPSNMHTGDPFYCSNCDAVLSKLSKLTPTGHECRTWSCEFCSRQNEVDLVDEEIPSADDVTYMLRPAPSTAGSGRTGEDQSLVVFCVDTSGSMCVTTEVSGSINLRGSRLDRLQSLNDTGESQYLPRQRKNVTYVSRLQGVQAAVDSQLEEMVKEHGSRRVALIAFSNEVTFLGDGTDAPVHVSGDKLTNKDELVRIGSELSLPNPVSQTRNRLGDKVFELEEGGQTALGPALLISISMACQVPGSKVIICTDGMANVGLGNLDQIDSTEESYARTTAFFDEISSMAAGKGVSVSVISIKGTDCKMVELGKVAEATGGQVNIVDPLKLTQEFGNILADPIIATNVSATLQLHHGLYFRHEELEQSQITRFVGNVTKASEVTFEYGVRRKAKQKASKSGQKEQKMDTSEAVYDNAIQDHIYDNPRAPCQPVNSGLSAPVQEGGASWGQATDTPTEPPPPHTAVNIAGVEGATRSGQSVQADTVDTVASGGDALGDGLQAGASHGASQRPVIGKDLTDLPFQLRIKYTDLDGAEALRVITQYKPVTRDREQAENAINMEAIGAHACQKSAALALKGEYTPSRMNAFMYQRLLHRNTDMSKGSDTREVYENFYENCLPMENRINSIQSHERRTHGTTYSDEEDSHSDSGEVLQCASKPRKTKAFPKVKSMHRRQECDDESAHVFYSNVAIASKGFKKK